MWIIHEGQNVVDSGTFYHLGSVRKHSDVQWCPWLSTNTETPLILCTQTTFTSVQPVVFLLLCNCASPFCFRRGPWVTVCSIIILCIMLKGAMEQWQLNNGLPVSACEDALGQLAQRNRKAVWWEGGDVRSMAGFHLPQEGSPWPWAPSAPAQSWLCFTPSVRGGTTQIPHSLKYRSARVFLSTWQSCQ